MAGFSRSSTSFSVGLSEAEYKVRIIDHARIVKEGKLLDSFYLKGGNIVAIYVAISALAIFTLLLF